MERLIGLVINDAALLGEFAALHKRDLDVAAGVGRGRWGMGFHGHGELLVKKAPLTRPFDAAEVLAGVRARLVVLAAQPDDRAREPEEAQPLRHRDWLFAATGTRALPEDFVTRVQASRGGSAFAIKPSAAPEEALQMALMSALFRANVRDARELTTIGVRRTLSTAAAELRALGGDTPLPPLAIVLHSDGYLFALALGRPLYVAHFKGLEQDEPRRRGAGRVRPRFDHLKAVVLTDGPPEGAKGYEKTGDWVGVEIGVDCKVAQFDLG